MTTGAFSQNVGKLFSELKLVTDNLLFRIDIHCFLVQFILTNIVRLCHCMTTRQITLLDDCEDEPE